MSLKRIRYSDLNARQKEIYNFQKAAAALADYGFNCIKLADDWRGADFLAFRADANSTLRVQLKARFTISKKYVERNLYMCFPVDGRWYLILHDELVGLAKIHSTYLESDSWIEKGNYSTARPGPRLRTALEEFAL